MIWLLTAAGLAVAGYTTENLLPSPIFAHWLYFFGLWGVFALLFHAFFSLYLWNFVWLKDLAGPKNRNLIFGHMDIIFLAESNSFYHQWERM